MAEASSTAADRQNLDLYRRQIPFDARCELGLPERKRQLARLLGHFLPSSRWPARMCAAASANM